MNPYIEKIFNNYQIKLLSNKDYIIIQIQNNNTSQIFKSKFNLDYLHQFRLLVPNFTIKQMIEFINILIDEKDIKIEENENELTFILISKITAYPNVELMLKKENMIEKLIQEIEEIKNENILLKRNYDMMNDKIKLIEEENKKLNIKFALIEKEKIEKLNKNDIIEKEENKNIEIIKKEDYEKLNMRINLIEKENEELNKKIEIITKKNNEEKKDNDEILNIIKIEKKNYEEFINNIKKEEKNNYELLNKIKIEKKNYEEFLKNIENENKRYEELNNKIKEEYRMINKIKNKIKILEDYHLDELNEQLSKYNLQNINSIQPHNNAITSISIFPSGNIVSVSRDKLIIIYDINLHILQTIKNGHNKDINYVEIKDEDNFITCSDDRSIKLWIKNNNLFIINKIIINAHEDIITKVIYYSNQNLISCSYDNKIKIWKENNNNKYENIKILTHSIWIWSILFLEDNNILISSGRDGTKFWNLKKNEINYNNIHCIKYFEDIKCYDNGGLCRLDKNRIIIGGDSLIVISILNKTIIKQINISFRCFGIRLIENKKIILIGGNDKDIRVYKNDNYECIQIIKDAHDDYIRGFVELKDGTIASFSNDKKIKIWNE